MCSGVLEIYNPCCIYVPYGGKKFASYMLMYVLYIVQFGWYAFWVYGLCASHCGFSLVRIYLLRIVFVHLNSRLICPPTSEYLYLDV